MNAAIQTQDTKVRELEETEPEQLTVLRQMLTGGEIVPAQLPSASHWTPELGLAAAVLAQAMADIRWRHADGRDHIQVAAAMRWVRAEDRDWPYSFLRVCELLQLEPAWVRRRIKGWMQRTVQTGRSIRQAA
ncbi:MAG: hypothetical protein SF182_29245 [Deltaproteobacteria bacterium]|nr:hypothetical protein [Deltaproteobacteria bacterium]